MLEVPNDVEHHSVWRHAASFFFASWYFFQHFQHFLFMLGSFNMCRKWKCGFVTCHICLDHFDPTVGNKCKNTVVKDKLRKAVSLLSNWEVLCMKSGLLYLGYSGPLQGFFPEGKDRTSGPWSNFLFIWQRKKEKSIRTHHSLIQKTENS